MSKEGIIFSTKPSLRRAYLFATLFFALVVFGIVITDFNPDFGVIWQSLLATLAGLLVFAHLRRYCTAYVIAEQEVQMKSGILARHSVVIPQHRITNVRTRQSFFERLLGIVNLSIDSAGGDAEEIKFDRITTGDARKAGKILREISARNQEGRPDSTPNARLRSSLPH